MSELLLRPQRRESPLRLTAPAIRPPRSSDQTCCSFDARPTLELYETWLQVTRLAFASAPLDCALMSREDRHASVRRARSHPEPPHTQRIRLSPCLRAQALHALGNRAISAHAHHPPRCPDMPCCTASRAWPDRRAPCSALADDQGKAHLGLRQVAPAAHQEEVWTRRSQLSRGSRCEMALPPHFAPAGSNPSPHHGSATW